MQNPHSSEDAKDNEEQGYAKKEEGQGAKTEDTGLDRGLELSTIPDRTTLHNVSDTRTVVGLEFGGARWIDLLDDGVSLASSDSVLRVELQPYQTAWLHTANSSD